MKFPDAFEVNRNADLLALVLKKTELKKVANTGGGEYAGPCPFCGGRDRFHIQPNHSKGVRWFCRMCSGGRWHTAIDFVIQQNRCDFREALNQLRGIQAEISCRQQNPIYFDLIKWTRLLKPCFLPVIPVSIQKTG